LFLDQSAKQSSVRTSRESLSFEAFKAVDGIYEPTNWIPGSLAHSNKENRPWWRV